MSEPVTMPEQNNRNISFGDLGDVAKDAFCVLSEDAQRFARVSASTITIPTLRGTQSLRQLLENNPQRWLNTINGARSLLCDQLPPPPNTGGSALPFSGGQCPLPYNVQYNISGNSRDCGGGALVPFNVSGPAPQFQVQTGPLSVGEVQEVMSSCGGSGLRQVSQALIVGDGSSPFGPIFSTGGNDIEIIDYDITWTVTPEPGNPDNCGNLPPEIGPLEPGDDIVPITIPTTDDMGNPVDEPANLRIYGPYVDDQNKLRFPFQIEYPDGSFQPGDFVSNDDEVEFQPGGPDLSPVCCDEGPIAEDPDNTGSFDELSIIGCSVRCDPPDLSAGLTVIGGTGGGPDLYLPDLGTLRFQITPDGADPVWTEGMRVQTLESYFNAPASATAVNFLPRPGVTGTGVPIVRKSGNLE